MSSMLPVCEFSCLVAKVRGPDGRRPMLTETRAGPAPSLTAGRRETVQMLPTREFLGGRFPPTLLAQLANVSPRVST